MSVHEDTATLFFHIEDHEVKLLRSLYLQTQEGKFYDITLVAHGVAVRAHQAVLCAHSEYFEALLSGRWTNTATHDLSYLFWSAATLKAVVNFMYTGNIEITKDNIEEILNAATHLLMENLRGACSKYLLANLAPKNCIPMWKLGDQYHLQEVEAMCQAIATSRFQDYLVKREDMLELDQAFMEKIIQHGLLDVVSKEEASRFLQAWQQHQKNRAVSEDMLEALSEEPLSPSILTSMTKYLDTDEDFDSKPASQPESNKEKSEDSQREDTTEAIFGYVINKEASCEKHPTSFEVYMYLAEQNSWKFVDCFEDSLWNFLLQAEHVGFVGNEAVYDGGVKHRSALVDFTQKTFRTISSRDKDALSRKMFCFDSQVFLIEDHKCPENNTIKHNVSILEKSSLTWKSVLDFDTCTLFPGFQESTLLSYTVLCQQDRAFIWAQDQTYRCTGPYWMCFQKDSTGNYTLASLERPPLEKDDLRLPYAMSMKGWKHASFRMSADEENLYVYRQAKILENSFTFDLVLTYELEANSWTRKENVSIELPRIDHLPIHSNVKTASNSQIFVPVDRHCSLQSVSHGSAYLMEKVCPFVTRMWAAHFGDGTWQQLTPPPVEGVEDFVRFSVVSMPQRLTSLIGSPPIYKGISDDAPHSPMVHWDLCLAHQSSDIKLQSNVAQRIQQTMFSFY